MPQPYFSKLHDPSSYEGFDVEVTRINESTAIITGAGLHALFEKLQAWGPGAANARFDVSTNEGTLKNCCVTEVSMPRGIEIQFAAGTE